ncbi:hypothetical protein AVEN_5279-1 [Araneus ventricosus]|uniref:Ionotropic glutamate receptor L-glutamate and glycine-binding domain-containing protein n=1 Tax=Araneus ventricosus TaxID=182803 RepID=A0A4Y2CXC1_ARAVE|nr:hypothetical protein AVEN_5279-1 [Araneus ventricosus]
MELKQMQGGKFEFGGIEGKFLEVVLKALKSCYEFIFPEDQEWGRLLPDGNWTGMIGKVQTGEADIAINFISPSMERMLAVDFSTPYLVDEIRFVIEKPGIVSPALAFLYPFSYTLWITCGVVLLLMALAMFFLLDVRYPFVYLFIQTFGSISRQPLCIKDISLRNRLLLSTWWFFAVIISFSYSAVLLSFLTIPIEGEPIKTFEELSTAVSKGTHKCFTSKGSSNLRMMLHSEKEYMKTLGKAIEDKGWYYKYNEVIDSRYINPTSASLGPKSMLQINSGSEMLSSMQFSTDSLLSTSIIVAMKKKFQLKRKLNLIISRLNSAGMYQKILHDESMKVWFDRQSETFETETINPLKLSDLSGAFVILLVGYGLSFIAFMTEIIVPCFEKRQLTILLP